MNAGTAIKKKDDSDDSVDTDTATTFDEQLQQKSQLQTRLTATASTFRAIEVQYRKLGLLYHSLHLASRQQSSKYITVLPTSKTGVVVTNNTAINITLHGAFDALQKPARLILTIFLAVYDILAFAKTCLWKYELLGARMALDAIDAEVREVRPIMGFLQEQIKTMESVGLPVPSEEERFELCSVWIVVLPEVVEAKKRKWGHGVKFAGGEALKTAFDALHELEVQDARE